MFALFALILDQQELKPNAVSWNRRSWSGGKSWWGCHKKRGCIKCACECILVCVCVLWSTSPLWAVSPDSVHEGRGKEGSGRFNRGCEIVQTELRQHTDGAGQKADRRKVTARKVSSPVDRWRLLIGLSITPLLRWGVAGAGLIGVYK